MPKWHFLVVLDSNEYQILGITIIIHVYYVLIIGGMFYTPCPVSGYSCIGHASHMHTRCTFAAHTLTLNMFCTSLMLVKSLDLLALNMFLCLCHAQVYIMFHHPQHVMFFMLYSIFLDVFVFRLSFIFSFILHPSCIIFHPCSYLLFFPSFLLSYLSIRDKKGESIPESIQVCIVISI